jgi:hypothetical protein
MEPSAAADTLAAYRDAGVTWWLENFDWKNSLDEVRTAIRRGPPRE